MQVKKKFLESPYGSLDVAFPECKGKLVYVWEDEVLNEELYKPPARFYVVTADGGRMYFKTNSRTKAQELADAVFGGKYIVRVEIKAQVR